MHVLVWDVDDKNACIVMVYRQIGMHVLVRDVDYKNACSCNAM
jgi:hypothetical protein